MSKGSGTGAPVRKSILESERSRKMVELLLNKGCKTELSAINLSRLDLSSLHMASIALVRSDLRLALAPRGACSPPPAPPLLVPPPPPPPPRRARASGTG